MGLVLAFAPPAQAGDAKCYLQGIISAVGSNEAKPSITDMLRMNFDANNKAKCEEMLKSYCFYNIREKSYTPVKLKAIFKPDVDKSEVTNYRFNSKCKLLVDDE